MAARRKGSGPRRRGRGTATPRRAVRVEKLRDAEAAARDPARDRPASVLSGRTIEDLEGGRR
jgi:hypothetical protein